MFLEPKQMFNQPSGSRFNFFILLNPPCRLSQGLRHGKVDPFYYINKRPSRACQGIITIFHDASFLASSFLKSMDHLSLEQPKILPLWKLFQKMTRKYELILQRLALARVWWPSNFHRLNGNHDFGKADPSTLVLGFLALTTWANGPYFVRSQAQILVCPLPRRALI